MGCRCREETRWQQKGWCSGKSRGLETPWRKIPSTPMNMRLEREVANMLIYKCSKENPNFMDNFLVTFLLTFRSWSTFLDLRVILQRDSPSPCCLRGRTYLTQCTNVHGVCFSSLVSLEEILQPSMVMNPCFWLCLWSARLFYEWQTSWNFNKTNRGRKKCE